jgi:hypothetical protein
MRRKAEDLGGFTRLVKNLLDAEDRKHAEVAILESLKLLPPNEVISSQVSRDCVARNAYLKMMMTCMDHCVYTRTTHKCDDIYLHVNLKPRALHGFR